MMRYPAPNLAAAATATALLLLLGSPLAAVAEPDDTCTVQRIAAANSNNRNYYKTQLSQSHSNYFKLEYDKTTKILWTDNKNQWNVDDRVERKYLLRQCGSTLDLPSANDPGFVANLGDDSDDTGFYGGSAGRQGIITVPVQNYIITSTTQIPYLVALDLVDKVRAYIGDPKYVSEPCLLARMSPDLPDDDPTKIRVISDTETFGKMTDPTNPDDADGNPGMFDQSLYDMLIMDSATVTLGACPVMDLFSGDATFCGVYPNLIDIMGWEEPHPKGRFEYMHLFAALSNTEKQALELTARKEKRWDCIENRIEHWNREVDDTTGDLINVFTDGTLEQSRPIKVAWFDYKGYSNSFSWADPCTVEGEDPYYCEMARACQITLIGEEEGDPEPDDIPGNIAKMQEADVVVYSGYFRDIDPAVAVALEEVKAWKELKFYDVTKKGSFTWFEDRVFNFEILLEDFCYVAGRHSKQWKHMVRYLRNVQREPEGAEAECLMVPKFKKKKTGPQVSCDYVEYNGVCARYKQCKTVKGRCSTFRKCRNKRKACTQGPKKLPRVSPIVTSPGAVSRNTAAATCDALPPKQARLVKFCPKQCGECCDNY